MLEYEPIGEAWVRLEWTDVEAISDKPSFKSSIVSNVGYEASQF